MSQYLDKVQIQTPTKRFRDFDLSCQHLTTSFFMRPTIAYAKEFPECKIKLNLKSYARLQPLLRPVLGSVQVFNRAFFVPFRTVWQPFTSFLVDAPWVGSSGSHLFNNVPTLRNSDIILVLQANAVSSDSLTPDFVFDGRGYEFTYQGRHYYKILRQLGYAPTFNNHPSDELTYSVLPLLCYARVFLDYYYPAQYAHSGTAAIIDGILNRTFRYNLSSDDLSAILEFTSYAYYRNDYFVAAWDNPVSPAAGTSSTDYVIPDISFDAAGFADANGDVRNTTLTGVPFVNNNDAGNYGLTTYQLDSLRALSNYIKRHQLVGARPLDRYLADFQVKLSSEILKRSVYIGSQQFPIQFSDVMSNADTNDAVLGDYAGKGVAFGGDGNFSYESDEFGYFIVVNTIEPDVCYAQGLDRNTLHKSRLDFLNGEFEQLGTQPVLKGELVAPLSSDRPAGMDGIFGFLPRYSEYKVGRDVVSGLFTLPSKSVGLLPWSTIRECAVGQIHNIEFMRGSDAWQYARIFYGDVNSAEDEIDKFFFVHRINLKCSMRAMPMYDTFEFHESEGDMIKMQANGTQLS